MIRPMILATESDVRRAVKHEELPIVKSAVRRMVPPAARR